MTNEQKFELLSAFMDGQDVDDSFLNEILSDPELMSKWESYSKVNASLKGDIPFGINLEGFSDKVKESLENQPIYINIPEQKSQIASDNNLDNVVDITQKIKTLPQRFFYSLSNLALVASVAIIFVFSVQFFILSQGHSEFSDVAVTNNGAVVNPVSNHNNDLKSISIKPSQVIKNNDKFLNENRLNASQLKKLEAQRIKEMQTIDALLRDHQQIKQTIYYR